MEGGAAGGECAVQGGVLVIGSNTQPRRVPAHIGLHRIGPTSLLTCSWPAILSIAQSRRPIFERFPNDITRARLTPVISQGHLFLAPFHVSGR